VESYDRYAPLFYGAKSFSRLRGQSYALRLAFFVECAGRAQRRRRFGSDDWWKFSVIELTAIQSAVAAALCRRTPKYYETDHHEIRRHVG